MSALLLSAALPLVACGHQSPAAGGVPADPCTGPAARADCLAPTRPAAYYVAEANRYFDTLDTDASPQSIPNYAAQVARWEWPPWLKLTGIGRAMMIGSDLAVTRLGTPSTVPERDCRAFAVQPFARCRVVIEYSAGRCPIYEEFSFNAQGEMTFIEAWSDLPGLHPGHVADDPWAEGPNVRRLATRLPGLGTPDGHLELDAPWMRAAARDDSDIADFVARAESFWLTWFQELADHGGDLSEDALYGVGCGWRPAG